MEVNGIAHVILTASNFERSREFYRKLLPYLGLQPMIDSDEFFYCVGRRQHRPRAARGHLGARLLFAAVRGPRWHQAGVQSCAGEGAAGVRREGNSNGHAYVRIRSVSNFNRRKSQSVQ